MGRARALVAGAVALMVGAAGNLMIGDEGATTSPGAGASAPVAARAEAPPGPPGTPAPVVRALGDRTAGAGVLLVVHGVVDPFEGADPVVTAPAGRRWIAAEVEVTNVAGEALDLSGHRFVLRDVIDRRFGSVETAEDVAMLDGPLGPGETRRGTVVFEAPEAASDLRLVYRGHGETLAVALG